jgi:hypothetical protein
MRSRLLVAALLVVSAASVVPATAKDCPADARAASRELWSQIPTGKTVTGRHSCGRRIQCTGGSGDSKRRSCQWL